MRSISVAAAAFILVGTAIHGVAQFAPGVFADANHPAGPPDPQRLDQIWQVDPMTGALYLTIPFTTLPVGGRGPKIPFALKYNSQSTVTLQSTGNLIYVNVSGTTPLAECEEQTADSSGGCKIVSASAPMPSGTPQIIMTYEWAPGAVTSPPGPIGPWTTTGPFLYNSTSSYPDQIIPGNGVSGPIKYGDGCATSGASSVGEIDGPYIYVDESGGAHDLNVIDITCTYDSNWISPIQTLYSYYEPIASGGNYGYGTQSSTSDGSAMLTTPNGVTYPDGTQYLGAELEDSNGNIATFEADSLGRTPFSTNIPIGQRGQFATGNYYVHTTNASGGTQAYSVVVTQETVGAYTMTHPTASEVTQSGYCLASITCPTNFAVDQVTAGSTFNAVTSITLPNGTAYTFCYDSSGSCGASTSYGLISKITFPTGGYVRFVYGIEASTPGYGPFTNMSSVVVTDAYVSDGVNPEARWSYSYPTDGSVGSTVTAPDGSSTKYIGSGYKFGLINMWNDPSKPTYKETSHTTSNSNGKAVETVTTTYAGALPGLIAILRLDGASSYQKQTQYKYDTYYNVTEKDETDWQQCSSTCPAASWIRITYTNYFYSQKSSWLTYHLVDKPYQVLVTDGSGVPYSFTQYGYDETPVGGTTGYTHHDDTNYGLTSTLPRGNVTTEKRCVVLPSTGGYSLSNPPSCSQWQTTTHTYDLAGQMLTTTDADSNTTSLSYTDSYSSGTPPGQTDGYVTTVTHPLGYTDTYEYAYYSGQMTQSKDWNLQPTAYAYSDPGNMGRLTQISLPIGGSQITYNDSSLPYITVTTTTGYAAGNMEKTTQYDGLGRVCETQLLDPAGSEFVDTSFDGNGRVHSVSNPYRASSSSPNQCSQSPESNPTNGATTYSYDGLNRLLTTTNPDGSTTSLSYAGPATTRTDENGNQWYNWNNGLGQFTVVREPNGSSTAPTWETDYTYSPLSNLIAAKQWGGANGSPGPDGPISRSFAYNGLSWLVAASNPENASAQHPGSLTCAAPATGSAWSACYTYDNVGNLVSRTDNRHVSTNYSYDAVYHLLSKSYSGDTTGTPSSCYQYGTTSNAGAVGRLINAWTEPAASNPHCSASPPSNGYLTLRSISSYDAMGRILSQTQCTPANCTSGTPYASAFTYYLNGSLKTWTNGTTTAPAGTITFTNTYDQAGHLSTTASSWSDATHPAGLFTAQAASSSPPCSAASAPSYSPAGALMNATLGTGVLLNRAYDSRLRTTCDSTSGLTSSGQTFSSGNITITGTELSK